MRAGISSENSSSKRSGIAIYSPPPCGEGLCRQRLVGAVAHRLFGGALAGAEPCVAGGLGLIFDGGESGHLVRTVAERLLLGETARAPPVALSGFDLDRDRLPSADCRHLAHLVLPPPAVASHASPQALASSRTRRI